MSDNRINRIRVRIDNERTILQYTTTEIKIALLDLTQGDKARQLSILTHEAVQRLLDKLTENRATKEIDPYE